MSSELNRLNRRRALIVAGQGMAAVLLAACGVTGEQSPATLGASLRPTSGGARGGSAGAAADTAVPEVTVPALSSKALPTGRPLLPLTPTTPGSTGRTSATAAAPTSVGTATGSTPTAIIPVSTSTGPTQTVADTTPTTPTTTSSATSTTSSASTSESSKTASPTSTTPPTSSRRPVRTGVAGRVVVLDAGHNGGNAAHPEIINQLIDGGYGQRNVCNTTGTQTDAGYPEHQFTWQVAGRLRVLLEAAGVTVLMTRTSDTGVGPCTNVRAAMENKAEADAVVSIHGDGAPPSVRGFYVLTATRPPAGPVIAARSLQLARAIADAAVAGGFPPSNSLGSGGLWKRDDLTGLNLSLRPKILIECGNMRNAVEAALMSSTSGQRRYAQALADGVVSYLTA